MAIIVTNEASLIAAVNAPPADGVIQIGAAIIFSTTLTIPATSRITIESVPEATYTLSPGPGVYPLINLEGQLALQQIVLDGTPPVAGQATKGIVTAPGSVLILNVGAVVEHFESLPTEAGAGIDSSGIVYMCDGTIQYNRALGQGGGVQLRAGYFYMYGGSINNNVSTTSGGGIGCAAGSTFYLNCGEIHDNRAAISGGAAYVDVNAGHTFVMNGGCVYNNFAELTGGAFFIISNVTQLMAQFNGGRLFDNTAGQAGGAICIAPNNPTAWVDIDGCVSITGNSGLTTPGPTQGGGAIYVITGILYVNNGSITDNHISGENTQGEQIFAVTTGNAQLYIDGVLQPPNTTFGTAIDAPIMLCVPPDTPCSIADCYERAVETEKTGTPAEPGLGEPIDYTISSVVTLGGGIPYLNIVDALPIWSGGAATLDTTVTPTATVILADGTQITANVVYQVTINPLTRQETITFEVVDERGNLLVLPAGTQVMVHFRINQDAPCGTELTNNATVFTAPCDHGTPITDTVRITCPEVPEITAEKTVSPTTAQIGDTVTYTITIRNVGSVPTQGLTITDTLPPGLTYVSGSETSTGGSIAQIGTPPDLIFALSDLQPEETTVITFQAVVNESAATMIAPNEAEVNPGDGGDPVFPISPPITITPPPPGAPEITAEKNVFPTTAQIGDTVTYTLTISNVGAVATEGLTVTDTLPIGLTYVPGSETSTGGSVIQTGTPPDLVFALSDLQLGETAVITFQAVVNELATDPIVPNEAEVSPGGGGDPVFPISPPINIIIPPTPPPKADTLTKTSLQRCIAPGDFIDYTITYTNGNPITDQLVITDYLPDGVYFDSGNLATLTINGIESQIVNTGSLTDPQFVIPGPIPADSTITLMFTAYTCYPCGLLVNLVIADHGTSQLRAQDSGVRVIHPQPVCPPRPKPYPCRRRHHCSSRVSNDHGQYAYQAVDLTPDRTLYRFS
ncbi:MAG: DUF11 domain-containing protein [Defluviitaleaceae bacterium]|nr:DUF11 domain-containing protein [Defluviitaleaceae bacterium]